MNKNNLMTDEEKLQEFEKQQLLYSKQETIDQRTQGLLLFELIVSILFSFYFQFYFIFY